MYSLAGTLGRGTLLQKEFPTATCRSLTQAIRATSFEGVTFYIGKGVYRHGANGTQMSNNSWISRPASASSALANLTNFTETPPILHHAEEFPISFPHIGAQLVAMDYLSPPDVVIDCGGNMCFDFAPSLHSNKHPLMHLRV